jgi:astacin
LDFSIVYVLFTGTENNFEITPDTFVTTQGIPYDLGSVMHYGAFAFSRNRQPTIEPVNPNVALNSLGQRNGFSSSDIDHVNTLYCGGACKLPTSMVII